MQIEIFQSEDIYSIEEYTNDFVIDRDVRDIRVGTVKDKNATMYYVVITYVETQESGL